MSALRRLGIRKPACASPHAQARARVVSVLDVLSALEPGDGITADDLAAATGRDPAGMADLLDGLAEIGACQHAGGGWYTVTPGEPLDIALAVVADGDCARVFTGLFVNDAQMREDDDA